MTFSPARKRLRPVLSVLYRAVAPFADPLTTLRRLRHLPAFISDYRAYSRLEGAEALRLLDLYPCLDERTPTHEFDAHYFYVNPWAARRIVACRPRRHLDIASQTVLSTMLSAFLPATYVDYRPLPVQMSGMSVVCGQLQKLPFRDRSVASLSCLHVAEHVGLGRYGDPLDPAGTGKAALELARILAPGGNLFFAVPVGRERVAFNAHRIHRAGTIREYFAPLKLIEFSGVGDDRRIRERAGLEDFDECEYGLGMFWFQRER